MKKTTITALSLISLLLSLSLSAQDNSTKNILPGSWLGKISAGGKELRLIFNLKLTEKDSLEASMDSPDQGAKNIKLGQVIVNEHKFAIQAPLIRAEYNGTIVDDTTINGIWTQGGNNYTVNLIKLKKTFAINRPQEPKPIFPYISKDVVFTNTKAGIDLAGTLTMPEGDGPFPAVILISGSGPQNRDEELFGHKPFLVLADWLTRKGIAVLRYDDRGVGKSQGKNYISSTSADLATDAEAAFDYLKTSPKINPKKIGFAGHSEGGLIAPIVAASNREVAFIVSLAGPGIKGDNLLLRQTQDFSRASGVSEDVIIQNSAINRKIYDIIKNEKDDLKAESLILKTYDEFLSGMNLSADDFEKAKTQLKSSSPAVSRYAWLRYFFITDPANYWKKVKCPVLAINGEKDLQVAADENLPAIEKALKSGRNKSFKTIKLPELNHLFQHCKTGLTAEYGEIEETFSPEVLKIISDWILDLK